MAPDWRQLWMTLSAIVVKSRELPWVSWTNSTRRSSGSTRGFEWRSGYSDQLLGVIYIPIRRLGSLSSRVRVSHVSLAPKISRCHLGLASHSATAAIPFALIVTMSLNFYNVLVICNLFICFCLFCLFRHRSPRYLNFWKPHRNACSNPTSEFSTPSATNRRVPSPTRRRRLYIKEQHRRALKAWCADRQCMAVLEDEKILVEEEESEGPRTTRNYQIFHLYLVDTGLLLSVARR